MKNGWRIIMGIVMAALLLGGLCCGVGLLTGADYHRIVLNLDEHYQLTTYVNAYSDYVVRVFQYLKGLIL